VSPNDGQDLQRALDVFAPSFLLVVDRRQSGRRDEVADPPPKTLVRVGGPAIRV
jgi:hypothetical protein